MPGIAITSTDGKPLGEKLLPVAVELIKEISEKYCPNCEQKKEDCRCKSNAKKSR